jgi:tryptophan synthase beta chain
MPDMLIACVGGGSNAIGLFTDFLGDADVKLVGVEPAGRGLHTHEHGATVQKGRPGILHGARSLILQDDDGQIRESHSISAGLDYPAVGPEHAWLHAQGRVEYVGITDDEALAAFAELARCEGILPALESAHALAHAKKLALTAHTRRADRETLILVNLSGRGDKDLAHVMAHAGDES